MCPTRYETPLERTPMPHIELPHLIDAAEGRVPVDTLFVNAQIVDV